MTYKEQLAEWVKGNSIHNDERDVCCPDFSCCQHGFMASEEDRKTFAQAVADGNETLQLEYLGHFLSEALALATREGVHSCYIAGLPITDHD